MHSDKMNKIKDAIVQEREALIEMYKAGFLDAYKVNNKLRKNEDWGIMNEYYKKAFFKRFEKRIIEEAKK